MSSRDVQTILCFALALLALYVIFFIRSPICELRVQVTNLESTIDELQEKQKLDQSRFSHEVALLNLTLIAGKITDNQGPNHFDYPLPELVTRLTPETISEINNQKLDLSKPIFYTYRWIFAEPGQIEKGSVMEPAICSQNPKTGEKLIRFINCMTSDSNWICDLEFIAIPWGSYSSLEIEPDLNHIQLYIPQEIVLEMKTREDGTTIKDYLVGLPYDATHQFSLNLKDSPEKIAKQMKIPVETAKLLIQILRS